MKIKGSPPSSDIGQTIISLSQLLGKECDRLEEVGNDKAVKEDKYERLKSDAIKIQTAKSKELREANAFDSFADAKLEFEKASNLQTAIIERVRSLRQTLSALQTLANQNKAVAEMLGFGQKVDR